MKVATRRLLEEQLVVVAILGSGKKSDAMWHVPNLYNKYEISIKISSLVDENMLQL